MDKNSQKIPPQNMLDEDTHKESPQKITHKNEQKMSAEEIERYERHILLKEIGGAGQQKLAASKVLIVGLGGLGVPVAQYLVAAGVGQLGFLDDDTVALSNLQRQVIFCTQDVGRAKVEVAAERLQNLNPHVTLTPIEARLTPENAEKLIADYDIVVDACDNFATRFAVNDACAKGQKILVSGAVGQFSGQVAVFKPWDTDENGAPLPCYRSLVPQPPPEADDCATTGIVGALCGIIGSLQAFEVIKEITAAGDSLAGRLLIYDGLSANARVVKLRRDPNNGVLSQSACAGSTRSGGA